MGNILWQTQAIRILKAVDPYSRIAASLTVVLSGVGVLSIIELYVTCLVPYEAVGWLIAAMWPRAQGAYVRRVT